MEFRGEWKIDDSGRALWHQGFFISNEAMKAAYLGSTLIGFLIESSAVMGVKVGLA